MFITYLRTVFHMSGSSGSLIIAIKLKYKFRADAMFFYLTQKCYLDRSYILVYCNTFPHEVSLLYIK
jgi:hypothetical protein